MTATNFLQAECMLNIGEVKAFSQPALITCFGLGSCVGLFLFDRVHKIGGGVHIMLPKFEGRAGDGEIPLSGYADCAVEALMQQMKIKGSPADGLGLRAKLVGGANLFAGDHLQVGKKNVVAVLAQLLQRKIYVAGTDVGGTLCRTARFYTESGKVEINTSTHKYII